MPTSTNASWRSCRRTPATSLTCCTLLRSDFTGGSHKVPIAQHAQVNRLCARGRYSKENTRSNTFGIREVYEQVAELFKDQPDLLDEFTHFLPDQTGQVTMQGVRRTAAGKQGQATKPGQRPRAPQKKNAKKNEKEVIQLKHTTSRYPAPCMCAQSPWIGCVWS